MAIGRCGAAKLLTYTQSDGSGRARAVSSSKALTDCWIRAPLVPMAKMLNPRWPISVPKLIASLARG